MINWKTREMKRQEEQSRGRTMKKKNRRNKINKREGREQEGNLEEENYECKINYTKQD